MRFDMENSNLLKLLLLDNVYLGKSLFD